ncbi:probable inactive leucine-rich repeat receptor-like protein kinase At3g03770 [Chenopodium quinoa]|uniref:probable inactive leucine-rich repeat receptor-like protein kinase At3g03770 n=1 Tax=Chenopodium quinoa TaxID=63459 RepID=UPI000B78213C|nr:probable inactive leucine-rich repeat receptor-like protein kinase At3g03770 [Chenopodium quinoa]
MEKTFKCPFLLLLFMILLQTHFSNQMPQSQLQAFFTIHQILNYPLNINSLDQNIDICSFEPSPYLTIACYEENITQIHTQGFIGFVPVSGNISMEALFGALAALPSLKVLSLVSLGLRGPLPQSIGNLTSLEMLNLSSNQLNGTIPVEILGLRNLQTVVLDHNEFIGEVPFWIGSLSELTVLSLKNNSLNGSLPTSLSRLEGLRILQLSINNINGEVPDLRNLTNLQVLDLGNNSLGPTFPTLHNKLVTLVLRRNKFRFGITDNMSSFYQLQKLDVSYNEFVEPFMPSLLSLPSIGYVNIAGNKFHGMLLQNMTCGADLNFVDLSFNYLTGDLPACLKSRNRSRNIHYRGNCLSNGRQRQHPYAFCHNEALAVEISPHKGKEKGSKVVVAMSIVGATSLAGLMVLGVGLVFSKQSFKKPQTRVILEKVTMMYPSKLLLDAREICQMAKLGPLGLPAYRNFLLDEIKEATANFDASNLIREGSSGLVYKGILANDNLVAIQCLKVRKRRGTQAYTHDIELLSKLRHINLVSALGHCFEYNTEDSTVSRIYLVFELVTNGNLRDFIFGQKPTWAKRITVAVEVAKGIQFLQTGMMPGLYSNNIKTTNVLLDHSLHVKLNSYNLPLLAENMDKANMLPSSGSKENGKAIVKQDEKSDVYDFGVILLEIIVGREITSDNDISVVKDLFEVGIKADKIARKQILDPAVHKECPDNSVKTLMELCVRSLSNDPNDRPSIEDVLWNLHFAAQIQESGQVDGSSDRSLSPVFTSQ